MNESPRYWSIEEDTFSANPWAWIRMRIKERPIVLPMKKTELPLIVITGATG